MKAEWLKVSAEIANDYTELELNDKFFLRVWGRMRNGFLVGWTVTLFYSRNSGNYAVEEWQLPETVDFIEKAKRQAIELYIAWCDEMKGLVE